MDKYQEALERAKKGLPIDEVFPELKESEDERIIDDAIQIIRASRQRCAEYGAEADKHLKAISYLEKQKEPKDVSASTMAPWCWQGEEKSAEWSEEDEQFLLVCKNALQKYQSSDKWDAAIIYNWLEKRLKSLRPQPHWKPSEEQMSALEYIIRSWGESGTMSPQNTILCAAKSLLNDLKKL